MIGTDAFQEIDTYGLTVPITKHNYLVRSAGELLEVDSRRLPHRDLGPAGTGRRRRAEGRADARRIEVDRLPEPGRAGPAASGRPRRRSRAQPR